MIILAFDTALASCSAAVIRDGAIVSEIFDDRARGQAERLVPMCLEACAAAEISIENMDAVAVTRGPGTFTGVRIGLAAARGMALALARPLIGVTTLEVTACKVAVALGNEVGCRIAICHDARRSEAYLQIFDLKSGRAVAASIPAAVPLAEVARHLDERVAVLAGTAVDMVRPLLSPKTVERLVFPDMPDNYPDASPEDSPNASPDASNAGMVGLMAWERLSAAEEVTGEVAPLYLRPPDAVAAKIITYPFQNL